ncbi:MAG: hypothetical protein AAGF48_13880 [Pseudomonadota bacterium]
MVSQSNVSLGTIELVSAEPRAVCEGGVELVLGKLRVEEAFDLCFVRRRPAGLRHHHPPSRPSQKETPFQRVACDGSAEARSAKEVRIECISPLTS